MTIELTQNEQLMLNRYQTALNAVNKDREMLIAMIDSLSRVIVERGGGDPASKSYVLNDERTAFKEVEDGVA